ncbi:A24 family peptidase [Gammaproteobacteria bacterium]|nr:A24 family peptidase [Gammaproteobacteria bacterium]
MDVIYFIKSNLNLFLVLIAALSLIVGSFLNVLIYRLPKMIQNEWNQECREYLGLKHQPSENDKLNLYLPLSHCTNCKKKLKPWHNIPLISYIVLKGKCAYCKINISMRYPFVELLCCAASVYVAWKFGFTWQTLGGLFFTWTIISLTFIDIDTHLLPDQLTYLLIWTGLFLSLFNVFCNTNDAILGAIIGYLIFYLIQLLFKLLTGKIGMGQGDFKYLSGFGAFLGWQQLPLIILLASIIGSIFGISQMILKQQYKSTHMPFGPYLTVGGWISLIWGNEILQMYLNYVVIK